VKVLLDTNICIAVMRGNEKAVSRLAAMSPGDCGISTIAVFELFVGVGKCANPPLERAKVTRFLSAMSVLSFDESAAIRAGELRAEMERNGNSVGPYDMLLAAHALALGLTFVTHNTTELSRVSGLHLDDWL
jgi:tRNA(fMet)-specific endonuclease VapC